MTTDDQYYDSESGVLSLVSDEVKAEFKVATSQAVENNEDFFTFYGYEIETSAAVDVVEAINQLRTYH